ncbi:MAG: aminotransferase IV [Corynebacteriales bacterium]|nr:aminotransferase IV [Mycobacteriales bacterium]
MRTTPIIAVLESAGPRLVPVETPLLRADDMGLTRGEGAFETMHVRNNAAWLLDEHLDRLERSLSRLHIPAPERSALTELVRVAIAGWGDTEAGVKIIVTKGAEFGGIGPFVYAVVFPVPEIFTATRRHGVRLASLSWGFPVLARERAPWLLGGVKSLSYAANMAALREAAHRGMGDVLLMSADDYVLEAPTASVVWQRGASLFTTPTETGILAGTTAAYLFTNAAEIGLTAGYELISRAELIAADGAWLCSSVRGIVPIVEIDASPLPIGSSNAAIQELVGFPM